MRFDKFTQYLVRKEIISMHSNLLHPFGLGPACFSLTELAHCLPGQPIAPLDSSVRKFFNGNLILLDSLHLLLALPPGLHRASQLPSFENSTEIRGREPSSILSSLPVAVPGPLCCIKRFLQTCSALCPHTSAQTVSSNALFLPTLICLASLFFSTV